MVARAALGFALAVVVAGCGGSGRSSTHVDNSDLPRLVVTAHDLPAVFASAGSRRQQSFELQGDATRFGRIDGWISRFKRAGSADTPGALVVESRADVFDSADGAKKELDRRANAAATTTSDARAVAAPALGDASRAATYTAPGLERPVRFYVVVWRRSNVVASVDVEGFKVTLADAVALARHVDARIARASS
jgi:hypothetical protein